jgi:Bacterial conjugation TrbI-like protein
MPEHNLKSNLGITPMTKFPIPDSLRTPSDSDNGEINSDWERRMAKLVGFEPELTRERSEASDEANTDNVDESPQANSDSRPTGQPLSSNPFAKAGLVGAATLLVVLGAGAFLSLMMNGTNKKPNNDLPLKQPEKLQPVDEAKKEVEIEVLKTKLALAEQARAVKAAQLQLTTVQPNQAIPAKVNPTSQVQPPKVIYRDKPRIVVQRIPSPVQTVYVPRTVTVERIVRVLQPIPQAKSPITAPQKPKIVPSVTPVPQEPKITPSVTPLPQLASNPQIPSIPQPTPTPTPTPANNSILQQLTTSRDSQSSTENQASQQPPKSVAVGTSAKAVLATSLFGESNRSGNDSDNANDSKFIVRLQQPLKNVDNAVALPAGTEVLTQIRKITESGMVQLEVVSVISRIDGNLREKSLPKGALKISSPQGRPLIASKYPDKSGAIAGMDVGIFALGGVNKAAELFNRPESTLNINGSNVISQNNTKPNIVTGILEGGLSTVVPQITVRNQQAISEMMTRGNIWFLPAGTQVEVFVNQTTQF